MAARQSDRRRAGQSFDLAGAAKRPSPFFVDSWRLPSVIAMSRTDEQLDYFTPE